MGIRMEYKIVFLSLSVIVLILLYVFKINFLPEKNMPYQPKYITLQGVGIIKCYSNLERGACDILCVYCKPENYTLLHPINLLEEFKKNNTEVEFTAKVLTNATAQGSVLIEILNISSLSALSKEKILLEILGEISEIESELEVIENETR